MRMIIVNIDIDQSSQKEKLFYILNQLIIQSYWLQDHSTSLNKFVSFDPFVMSWS